MENKIINQNKTIKYNKYKINKNKIIIMNKNKIIKIKQ
jgi:hypothetical protein